jgi:hypothetical protein
MLPISGITFINDCQMIGNLNNLKVFMSKKTKILKYDQLRSHMHQTGESQFYLEQK